eukprot:gene13879-19804_t
MSFNLMLPPVVLPIHPLSCADAAAFPRSSEQCDALKVPLGQPALPPHILQPNAFNLMLSPVFLSIHSLSCAYAAAFPRSSVMPCRRRTGRPALRLDLDELEDPQVPDPNDASTPSNMRSSFIFRVGPGSGRRSRAPSCLLHSSIKTPMSTRLSSVRRSNLVQAAPTSKGGSILDKIRLRPKVVLEKVWDNIEEHEQAGAENSRQESHLNVPEANQDRSDVGEGSGYFQAHAEIGEQARGEESLRGGFADADAPDRLRGRFADANASDGLRGGFTNANAPGGLRGGFADAGTPGGLRGGYADANASDGLRGGFADANPPDGLDNTDGFQDAPKPRYTMSPLITRGDTPLSPSYSYEASVPTTGEEAAPQALLSSAADHAAQGGAYTPSAFTHYELEGSTTHGAPQVLLASELDRAPQVLPASELDGALQVLQVSELDGALQVLQVSELDGALQVLQVSELDGALQVLPASNDAELELWPCVDSTGCSGESPAASVTFRQAIALVSALPTIHDGVARSMASLNRTLKQGRDCDDCLPARVDEAGAKNDVGQCGSEQAPTEAASNCSTHAAACYDENHLPNRETTAGTESSAGADVKALHGASSSIDAAAKQAAAGARTSHAASSSIDVGAKQAGGAQTSHAASSSIDLEARHVATDARTSHAASSSIDVEAKQAAACAQSAVFEAIHNINLMRSTLFLSRASVGSPRELSQAYQQPQIALHEEYNADTSTSPSTSQEERGTVGRADALTDLAHPNEEQTLGKEIMHTVAMAVIQSPCIEAQCREFSPNKTHSLSSRAKQGGDGKQAGSPSRMPVTPPPPCMRLMMSATMVSTSWSPVPTAGVTHGYGGAACADDCGGDVDSHQDRAVHTLPRTACLELLPDQQRSGCQYALGHVHEEAVESSAAWGGEQQPGWTQPGQSPAQLQAHPKELPQSLDLEQEPLLKHLAPSPYGLANSSSDELLGDQPSPYRVTNYSAICAAMTSEPNATCAALSSSFCGSTSSAPAAVEEPRERGDALGAALHANVDAQACEGVVKEQKCQVETGAATELSGTELPGGGRGRDTTLQAASSPTQRGLQTTAMRLGSMEAYYAGGLLAEDAAAATDAGSVDRPLDRNDYSWSVRSSAVSGSGAFLEKLLNNEPGEILTEEAAAAAIAGSVDRSLDRNDYSWSVQSSAVSGSGAFLGKQLANEPGGILAEAATAAGSVDRSLDRNDYSWSVRSSAVSGSGAFQEKLVDSEPGLGPEEKWRRTRSLPPRPPSMISSMTTPKHGAVGDGSSHRTPMEIAPFISEGGANMQASICLSSHPLDFNSWSSSSSLEVPGSMADLDRVAADHRTPVMRHPLRHSTGASLPVAAARDARMHSSMCELVTPLREINSTWGSMVSMGPLRRGLMKEESVRQYRSEGGASARSSHSTKDYVGPLVHGMRWPRYLITFHYSKPQNIPHPSPCTLLPTTLIAMYPPASASGGASAGSSHSTKDYVGPLVHGMRVNRHDAMFRSHISSWGETPARGGVLPLQLAHHFGARTRPVGLSPVNEEAMMEVREGCLVTKSQDVYPTLSSSQYFALEESLRESSKRRTTGDLDEVLARRSSAKLGLPGEEVLFEEASSPSEKGDETPSQQPAQISGLEADKLSSFSSDSTMSTMAGRGRQLVDRLAGYVDRLAGFGCKHHPLRLSLEKGSLLTGWQALDASIVHCTSPWRKAAC